MVNTQVQSVPIEDPTVIICNSELVIMWSRPEAAWQAKVVIM